MELSAAEVEIVREALEDYLADFRRQVAGAENPEFRHQLQQTQNALERVVGRLRRAAA